MNDIPQEEILYDDDEESGMTRRDALKYGVAATIGAAASTVTWGLLQVTEDDPAPCPEPEAVETLEQNIQRVIAECAPSTCKVSGSRGSGSGVIVESEDGVRYIVTNGHIANENSIPLNGNDTYHIRMFNGSDDEDVSSVEFESSLVVLSDGSDALAFGETGYDLALLSVPADIELSARGIRVRRISERPVKVGESVVAFGAPHGITDHVTTGRISHNDGRWVAEPANKMLRTDTPTNPGNSGGALVDMNSEIVGINTYIIRGADGIAGSIRCDSVLEVFEKVWNIPLK